MPRFHPAVSSPAFLFAAFALAATSRATAAAPDFERDVAPILVTRCLECHVETEAAGGLVLTTRADAFKGGESGPAIVPGDAGGSYLLDRITPGEMPPEKKGVPQPLPEKEAALLRAWIEAGAEWPASRKLDPYERTTEARAGRDWWSLRPVVRPAVPETSGVDNPIDAFILASLRVNGLEPAPEADRRTLIRRVYYDLVGLPPSAEEIEAFVADDDPDAYERLVDRLLVSPAFGERWARYWLDIARYADTSGYERDQEKPGAWRYRDWVVCAINEDKPFDRFVTEQLAGDELPDRCEETVVATGFLRLGTWNDEPNDPEEYKYERLEDLVQVTSAAFLGLTVKCARCHDHKFDPIPQADYYRVANAFWPGPIEPRDRELLGGPTREELGFDVLGWTDVRDPPPLFLMKKGDPHQPLFAVEPGVPTVPAIDTPNPKPAGQTTGRRLQLAQWLTDPANPLPARVFVNRLWQRHFGEGIVRTPDNFGFLGDQPTHPELLDWLASELVRDGWQAKPLHRLMLTSRTYRQASIHPHQDEYADKDPGNRLWWRAERRRLDAEAMRDSLLVSSGELDRRIGGPSFKADVAPEALEGLSMKSGAWQPSPPEEQRRRSLYLFSQRSLLPPLMTAFDFVGTTEPCGRRDVSTVAPQALSLLNNPFAHEQSGSLADRVIAQAGGDTRSRVELAWRLALGRAPSPAELDSALAHLEAQAQAFEQRPSAPREGDGPIDLLLFAEAVLRLRSDAGVTTDDAGRVASWEGTSDRGHVASQSEPHSRPMLATDDAGRPVVRFDGWPRLLRLDGQILVSPNLTIVAVAADRGTAGHREIFSNWDGAAGNSVRSVFLGTTDGGVRFSDDFPASGRVPSDRPFLLVATTGENDATVHLDGELLARKGSPLNARRLDTPYVLGTQGNFGHEFWNGDLYELAVFDRPLDDVEREAIWRYARSRYGLAEPAVAPPSADRLALASLCHVLLNTNEFLYVD